MVAASSDSIHIGSLKNAFGAIAVGRGAIAINLSFGLIQRVVLGKNGGEVAFDPRAEVSRPPLTPPHPHGTEPELGNLIGRHAELQALLGMFQKTYTGDHGAMVWIAGEPGMGRNALGRRFVQLVEDAEPAPDLRRRTFTLLTLSGRFWMDPDLQQQAQEPRTQDVWGEWSDYIRRSFPRSCAAAGPTWISLMSQLAATNEGRGVPPGLRDEPASLLSFLRLCLQDCDAGVLTLEQVDAAPDEWIPLLDGLARETARDLKLVVVATIRSDRPIQDLTEAEQTPLLRLALNACQLEIASALWFGPIEYAEFENCYPGTDESVRQALYRLTGGAPLWLEAMWEDWKSRNQVKRGGDGNWRAAVDFAGGNARQYAEYLIRQALAQRESNFEFTFNEVMQILCAAALEGPVFSLQAIAEATDFDAKDVSDFLALELTGSKGLVAAAFGISFTQAESGLRRSIRRMRFEPLGGYFVLECYLAPQERQVLAYRLANALERVYWPYPEYKQSCLARLFALGGTIAVGGESVNAEEQEKRTKRMAYYGRAIRQRDDLEELRRAAEFWRLSADDPVASARLVDAELALARKLLDVGPISEASLVARQAAERAALRGLRFQTAISLTFEGHALHQMGSYTDACARFDAAYVLFEELGKLHDMAAIQQALGRAKTDLGLTTDAYGHLQRANAIFERTKDDNGIGVTLVSLGELDVDAGRYAEAHEKFVRALEIAEMQGRDDALITCWLSLGQLDLRAGSIVSAGEHLSKALAKSYEMANDRSIALCLHAMGEYQLRIGEHSNASDSFQRSLVMNERLGSASGIAACSHSLARMCNLGGNILEACRHFERALMLYRQMRDPRREAQTLEEMSKLSGGCQESIV